MSEQATEQALALFGDVMVLDRPVVTRTGQTPIDLMREWVNAWDMFLASRKSDNTRRAYEKAVAVLLAYTSKPFWQIDRTDMFEWVAGMRGQGLSDATIQQRVAAVSAFYTYTNDEYEVTYPDGSKAALFNRNPAASKSLRPQVEAFSNVNGLSGTEVGALMRAIPQSTVQGLRDFALFSFYLSTGRRNSEIRRLKKGDFRHSKGQIQYRWSGKRKDGWDECTPDVWGAIHLYLEKAGRPFESLADDAYIFTALNDRAGRLKNISADTYVPTANPLSMRQVGDLLKKYARKAGLDDKAIHVHVLRHTVAGLMDEAGFTLRDIQERLKHSSLDMTNRYMDRLKGQKNQYWARVKALHGLPDSSFDAKAKS